LTFGKGFLEDSIPHLSFTKLATAYSGLGFTLTGLEADGYDKNLEDHPSRRTQ
jgi:hypothetical protein